MVARSALVVVAGAIQELPSGDTLTGTSGGYTGFRNRIINGGMQIDQRNNGAAQTITAAAALAYTVDRFYAYCTGANVTGQQVAGSVRTRKRYQFTGAASVTAIGFGTRLEAKNTYDLNNQTVTISADIANSLLTTVSWTLYRATTTEDTFGTLASPTVTSVASGSWTVTSTVTRYSAQAAVTAASTTGLQLVLTVGAQTSGTWTVGDVQLELGSTATAFEVRHITAEQNLCSAYAYLLGDATANPGTFAVGGAWATTIANYAVIFPVRLRATPTFLKLGSNSAYSHFNTQGNQVGAATGFGMANASPTGALVSVNVASGLTVGQPYFLGGNNTGLTGLLFSAEL